MKVILQILITLIFSYLLSLVLPIWGLAIAGFIAALIFNQNSWKSFISGFLGVAILWALTTWILSGANNHILLPKVAGIFSLSSVLFLVIIAMTGGLLGGVSAAAGTELRKMIFHNTARHY